MRIIIEIDGDNVAVHTDRQPGDRDSASVENAGSAPVELLRQFGAMESTETKGHDGPYQDGPGRYDSSPDEETPLNPLRAGEAIARQRLGYPTRLESQSFETVDAGAAPKLPAGPPGGSEKKKKKKKKESYGKE
jgi:hypothetical protein